MNWFPYLLLVVVFALFWLIRRAGLVSEREAIELLRKGGVLLDVRTAGEFVAGHLAGAVNLPLNEIETQITRRAEARDQVLLLHCQSGARSGMACKKLKAMGYLHVFNLGSYARAASILGRR
ncbi:rhodanese-like domain-containing protein [Telmatobacter bradus]|uniref:rhodanese-like domain-containing protein n=1 Tax=Telmatobacter bradus TaxID=474953 RepID=UPI003B42F3F1